MICLLNVFCVVCVEDKSFLALIDEVCSGINIFRSNYSKVIDTSFEGFSELRGFLVDGLHFVVEIG